MLIYRYSNLRDLHSFPTRRSSDLGLGAGRRGRDSLRHEISFDRRIFHGVKNPGRSEEHTSELQSRFDLVCRLLLEKKNITIHTALKSKHSVTFTLIVWWFSDVFIP